MRQIQLTLTIETDIEDDSELERVVRATLDNAATIPYLDFFDLEFEDTLHT